MHGNTRRLPVGDGEGRGKPVPAAEDGPLAVEEMKKVVQEGRGKHGERRPELPVERPVRSTGRRERFLKDGGV